MRSVRRVARSREQGVSLAVALAPNGGFLPELQHRSSGAGEIEGAGLFALRAHSGLVLETVDGCRLVGFVTERVGLRDSLLATTGVTAPVGACRDCMHAVAEVLDMAGVRATAKEQHAHGDGYFHSCPLLGRGPTRAA